VKESEFPYNQLSLQVLLLPGGNERCITAGLALTTKVRIDDCFFVAFVVATNLSILDSVAH